MNIVRELFPALIVMTCLTTLARSAPTTLPSDDVKVTEARRIAKNFLQAIADKKADEAKLLFHGAESERSSIDRAIREVESEVRLFAAIQTLPDGAELTARDKGFADFIKQVDEVPVFEDNGDILLSPDSQSFIRMTLKSVDGQLKVARFAEFLPVGMLTRESEQMNIEIDAAIRDVEAGKYTSAKQLINELRKKMKAIKAAKTTSTRPAEVNP